MIRPFNEGEKALICTVVIVVMTIGAVGESSMQNYWGAVGYACVVGLFALILVRK